MKKVLYILLTLSLLLTFAACGGETPTEPSQQEPASEQPAEAAEPAEALDVVIACYGQPTTLFGARSYTQTDDSICFVLYDPLVRYDSHYDLHPAIAESWKVLDDGVTWEVKIDQDAKFWDGTPVTADDVVWTINTCFDPENTTNTQYLVTVSGLTAVEKVDDYTVHFITETPYPDFPFLMKEFYISSKAHCENLSADELILNPMGSGPYKFEEWKTGEYVRVSRNEDYWAADRYEQKYDSITYRYVPEASSRMAMLLSEEVDFAQMLTLEVQSQVEGAGLNWLAKAGGSGIYLGINQLHGNEALLDKRVRQAMHYAVDNATICATLLNGATEPMTMFVTASLVDPELSPYPYDVEKAQALLAEAGYTLNADGVMENAAGNKLELKLMSSQGDQFKDIEYCQAVADYLTKAGIKTEVQTMDYATLLEQTSAREYDFDLWIQGSGMSFNYTGDLAFFTSNSSTNGGGWSNAEYDALYAQMASSFDPAEVEAMAMDLQKILYEECPIMFSFYTPIFCAMNDKMEGFVPTDTNRSFFACWE